MEIAKTDQPLMNLTSDLSSSAVANQVDANEHKDTNDEDTKIVQDSGCGSSISTSPDLSPGHKLPDDADTFDLQSQPAENSQFGTAYRTIEPMLSDIDSDDTSSDDDDKPIFIRPSSGPIKTVSVAPAPHLTVKTKGELTIEDLPPVEDIDITDIVSSSELEIIGNVMSIVDKFVVVQAKYGKRSLYESTVLFNSESDPIGRIFELFGRVNETRYTIRFNSREEIEEKGIEVGKEIFYAPQRTDLTFYVTNENVSQIKGSDASGEDNNEVAEADQEYSDDEQEMQAKRKKRVAKRNDKFRSEEQANHSYPPRKRDRSDSEVIDLDHEEEDFHIDRLFNAGESSERESPRHSPNPIMTLNPSESRRNGRLPSSQYSNQYGPPRENNFTRRPLPAHSPRRQSVWNEKDHYSHSRSSAERNFRPPIKDENHWNNTSNAYTREPSPFHRPQSYPSPNVGHAMMFPYPQRQSTPPERFSNQRNLASPFGNNNAAPPWRPPSSNAGLRPVTPVSPYVSYQLQSPSLPQVIDSHCNGRPNLVTSPYLPPSNSPFPNHQLSQPAHLGLISPGPPMPIVSAQIQAPYRHPMQMAPGQMQAPYRQPMQVASAQVQASSVHIPPPVQFGQLHSEPFRIVPGISPIQPTYAVLMGNPVPQPVVIPSAMPPVALQFPSLPPPPLPMQFIPRIGSIPPNNIAFTSQPNQNIPNLVAPQMQPQLTNQIPHYGLHMNQAQPNAPQSVHQNSCIQWNRGV